ncbi:MAG: M48 family metallopeptidase [Spirochaetaceae bacterium]|nr:M48 family metallopeptidase [Spirochaetaceae bacterium]
MHLSVKPPNGKVTVSAPLNMRDETIERFVRTKAGWIKRQVEKLVTQPRQSMREYLSGETLYVWGTQYFLRVEYGTGKNSLLLSGDKAVLTVREKSTVVQRARFVREWYRSILKKEIERVLPKWEDRTGLVCDAWQTKYMITRWGTCNIKKRKIWLNVQLAKKTPDCLEYVILHELVHLVEKHHNNAFISLMDKYMPYWRETKRALNDQILDFMA